NKIGMVEAKPINPSQKAELVRWSTSQPWATFCIQVPTLERKLPAQNQRNSRWRNARTMSGNSGSADSVAEDPLASAPSPGSTLAGARVWPTVGLLSSDAASAALPGKTDGPSCSA